MAPDSPVTVLFHECANGGKTFLDRQLPLVYAEPCRIARRHLRDERASHTLQPTALVQGMYARLHGQTPPDLRDSIHFLSAAARVMRQILMDHTCAKYARKHCGREQELSLDEAQHAWVRNPAIMIRIDDALKQLARHDPRKARLFEMRFFGGLTGEESAAVADVSGAAVRRDLRLAQAWFQRELSNGREKSSSSAKAAAG